MNFMIQIHLRVTDSGWGRWAGYFFSSQEHFHGSMKTVICVCVCVCVCSPNVQQEVHLHANIQLFLLFCLGSIKTVGTRDLQTITSSSVDLVTCHFSKTFVDVPSEKLGDYRSNVVR